MIYDRAFSNYSRIWQREMADWETEDCADDTTYTASLVSPATQNDTPAPLPLVAAIPTQEAAGADEDRLPGRQVVEGDAAAVLSPFAALMLGDCEECV